MVSLRTATGSYSRRENDTIDRSILFFYPVNPVNPVKKMDDVQDLFDKMQETLREIEKLL